MIIHQISHYNKFIKMEGSKFESLLTQEKGGYLKEEIIQSACECELCFHDVKPLV